MTQPLLPDADELIQIIAAELDAAMRTSNPEKHIQNVQRCARILRHRVDQANHREFPCPTCGEMRTHDFCINCSRIAKLGLDDIVGFLEVRR